MIKRICIVSILFLCFGCHSYETRTYEVTVHNATSSPIVVWLTKSGEPFEQGWLSPEEIGRESPKMVERSATFSWTTIDPGKTQGTGKVRGRFEATTSAILRIYRNASKFSDLLAISRPGGDRIDLELRPGSNNFTIESNGGLHAREAR